MVGSQKEDSYDKAGCGRGANKTKDFPPLILMVQNISGNDNDEIIFTEGLQALRAPGTTGGF